MDLMRSLYIAERCICTSSRPAFSSGMFSKSSSAVAIRLVRPSIKSDDASSDASTSLLSLTSFISATICSRDSFRRRATAFCRIAYRPMLDLLISQPREPMASDISAYVLVTSPNILSSISRASCGSSSTRDFMRLRSRCLPIMHLTVRYQRHPGCCLR